MGAGIWLDSSHTKRTQTTTAMGEMTELFRSAGDGDPAAVNQLIVVMYEDLHKLAHARLQKSARFAALDTTELVHESYLRFLKRGLLKVADRGHFLAYSARVMRSIIVDFVRARRAHRRGRGAVHVTLNTELGEGLHAPEDEIIRVSEALEDLAKTDPRLVQVVEMRYFAGLSEDEIASFLGVAGRTVRRDWQKARLLLSVALE
jgi:RNA polymerase sigma factor (TIGR02999 family)